MRLPHTLLKGALSVLAAAATLLTGWPAPPAHAQTTADASDRPVLRIESPVHSAPVRRLAVDPRRGIVVTASDDKTARIWDLGSTRPRAILRPPVGGGDLGRLYGAAIHPTRPWVAVGGTTAERGGAHRIYVFNTGSGRLERTFDARAGDVKSLAWTPDGSLLFAAFAGDDRLIAYDEDGRAVFEERFGGASYGIAMAPDGRVAASSRDGTVHLFSARGRQVTRLARHGVAPVQPGSLTFSPDGRRLAVGTFTAGAGVLVLDAATGAVQRTLAPPFEHPGDLPTVTWSADGRQVLVGGRVYRNCMEFPVFSYDAADGRLLGEEKVARDTITDLVALPAGGYAFASYDGSWGVVGDAAGRRGVASVQPEVRGAANLRVSADARTVRWTQGCERAPIAFDMGQRTITREDPAGLRAPVLRRGLFEAAGRWENVIERVEIGGRSVPLRPGEVARAFTYVGDGNDGILGTGWGIYRIGGDGAIRWRVPTDTTVWAVNASADGRLLVTTMADGTIRWWRASDGAALLTLYTQPDGSWVVWAPNGYFDASAGADRLVGWTVNRGADAAADHFTLGRFRDRFQRADVIDRIFDTLDPIAAVRAANEAAAVAAAASGASGGSAASGASGGSAASGASGGSAASGASAPGGTAAGGADTTPGAAVTDIVTAPPRFETTMLPPALAALGDTVLTPADGRVTLPFSVRAGGIDIQVEVRINGRPARPEDLALPRSADGNARGIARLTVPAGGGMVQLFARNRNGVSEPLTFWVEGAGQAVSAAQAADADRDGRSTLYLLAVGVSDYQRSEYRLGLAAKDARDFAAAMQKQSGRMYRTVVLRTLTDREATRAAVLRELEWLAASAGPGDTAMLFLAGHGLNGADGHYYFLPHDGMHERLAATGVAERNLRDALARVRGKAILFVDTCFAGNVLGAFRNASRELARVTSTLASPENGVVVFASSSGRQLSEEKDEWGNGAFTKALLEGLSGRADLAQTGRITFRALHAFVTEQVSRLTKGRQTPVTISPAGLLDFALARMI